ncbi:MAG: YeeE/YedE family protein [Burkholderiaceae bacterium]
MTDADVTSLQHTIAASAFAIAFVLGAAMNRTGFCTMGALSDVVTMGDWTRMRMWLLAIGVAVLGTQALAWSGAIDLSRSIYTGANATWLSYLVGGALFGAGMVLASGCGSKTLVRIGGGNLKSLVVFVVMGVFAYMTLKGLTGVARANFLDPVALQLAPGQDLPRLVGGSSPEAVKSMRLVIGGVLGACLIAFALVDRELRRAGNLLGGVVVGLGVVATWYVSAHLGYVAEDPSTLEERFVATNSGRPESLSFVAPAAYTLELLMFWSDTSRVVTVGIGAALGMIAGSFADALAARKFRWEGFAGAEDTANHLAGAALMGVGGVTALGCTIGQGLSGLSTLAVGSLIALAGILAGGVAALRYQMWRVDRMI